MAAVNSSPNSGATSSRSSCRRIADLTGGLYFRAENTRGLQEIYDTINELERSTIEVRTFTRYEELAAWLIVPAVLLLGLEALLRRTLLRTIP